MQRAPTSVNTSTYCTIESTTILPLFISYILITVRFLHPHPPPLCRQLATNTTSAAATRTGRVQAPAGAADSGWGSAGICCCQECGGSCSVPRGGEETAPRTEHGVRHYSSPPAGQRFGIPSGQGQRQRSRMFGRAETAPEAPEDQRSIGGGCGGGCGVG